jgi:uncharacterized protein
MPYFSVYAHDNPGMRAQRLELRPSHRARLRAHDHPVAIHVAGPLLSTDGEMVGSMFVIEAAERAAVERFMAGDPYVEAGLYRRCEIFEFAWGLGAPEGRNG